jgi:hypothetical protein
MKNMSIVGNHVVQKNGVQGLDLVVEKDTGNDIRILTGNKSIEFWKKLKLLCNDALDELESDI